MIILEILKEIETSDFISSSISADMAKVILTALKSAGHVS